MSADNITGTTGTAAGSTIAAESTRFRLAGNPLSDDVDERFRALAPDLAGRTLADVAEGRHSLFGGAFVSPVLVLRDSAVEHNLAAMAGYSASAGVSLAPHGKTTMAPQLVARQFDHGAWAVTAASVSQARLYRRFGFPRVLIANEVVDPVAVTWIAGQLADASFDLVCYVDSVEGVRVLEEGLAAAGAERPLSVLVEVSTKAGRAGCRDSATAVRVAAAIRQSRMLRLVGVSGFEGILSLHRDEESMRPVHSQLAHIRRCTEEIAAAGHFVGLDEVIVSAGGSAFFPEVVEAMSGGWWPGAKVRVVLRAGCYVTHDSGLYTDVSPFGAILPGTTALRPALELWSRVLSRPEPGLAILDFGVRDATGTFGFPVPFEVRDPAGKNAYPPKDFTITGMNDQHAYLRMPPDTQLGVGSWVGNGVSHPCLAFDRWSVLPLVDDADVVVDLVRTYF
jgi:D-serine deaminase-like pyridoxal phosphate-dependent protein